MRSTAVLVSYENITRTAEAVNKVFNTLDIPFSARSSSFWSHLNQFSALENNWNLFYFLLLPPNHDFSKYIELMERTSAVIPMHSLVYWIVQADEDGTSGNEELMIWEGYMVKNMTLVQQSTPASNIQNFSYFGELVQNKWWRRQDFQGSIITATAAVPLLSTFSPRILFRACLHVLSSTRSQLLFFSPFTE